MAIKLSKRDSILAGVGVLVLGAAAAWVFLDQGPPPKTVVKSRPPAAEAAREVAKEVAKEAAKEAAKAAPAQTEAKPAPSLPIPTNPDKLVAEILDASGQRQQLKAFQKDATMARHFNAGEMAVEIAANLKAGLDVERAGRFLELLRQPLLRRMTELESVDLDEGKQKELMEAFRRRPPPAAREKLMNAIAEVTGSAEMGATLVTISARAGIEAYLARAEGRGGKVTDSIRRKVDAEITRLEKMSRQSGLERMLVTYREVSDEDLAEYLKQLETDIGRWGSKFLVGGIRPVVMKRAIAMAAESGSGRQPAASATPATPPAAPPKAAPAPAAAAKAPARAECVFKPVMTDAELAACR